MKRNTYNFKGPIHTQLEMCSLFYTGKDTENSPPEDDSLEEEFINETPKELLDNAAQYDNTAHSPDDVWTKGPYPHHSNYA